MCTVSWVHEGTGYQLFCNRDEKRTRLEALPPMVHRGGNVGFIAPLDRDSGGTWIAVNEAGLTACLLNGRGGGTDRTTRGAIVRHVIGSASVEGALQAARDLHIEQFAPFTLALIEPGGESTLLEWTGRERVLLDRADHRLPLTSSSYQPEIVLPFRRELFQRVTGEAGRARPESLRRFHSSHEPHACARSVCMHRHDAETVSFTCIRVTRGSIEMRYQPSAPCRQAKPVVVRLLRD